MTRAQRIAANLHTLSWVMIVLAALATAGLVVTCAEGMGSSDPSGVNVSFQAIGAMIGLWLGVGWLYFISQGLKELLSPTASTDPADKQSG